jgi:GNAT superfamily N-acetyltransferase
LIEQIKQSQFYELKTMYDEKIKYFPIITSVIEGLQKGYVFEKKGTYLIVHKFGFSYILGENIDYINFLDEIKNEYHHLLSKIRLYDPMNRVKNSTDYKLNASRRIKYIYSSTCTKSQIEKTKSVSELINNDVNKSFDLELCTRFWSSCKDFKENSLGVVDMNMSGICYAAAIANSFAEIDVFVNEKARKIGLGMNLVDKFILECLQRDIIPLWDCYKNNIPSTKLAQKVKFTELFEYNYFQL